MSEQKGLWWFIATWFGVGHSPVISGTMGSLAALPFAWYIHLHFGASGLLLASFIMFIAGVWASNTYLRIKGGDDPSEIVADEVAGQWLLLAVVPLTWKAYAVGFVLFRIFDILKPWPVSWADRKVEGGMGVMLDDMLAGAYGILAYLLLNYYGILDYI